MLNSNYIQSLFGIKDGIIKNIENDDDGSIIHVHFEVRRDIHECPSCRELTDSIHDYRIQKIKGPPLGEKFILFHYRKRVSVNISSQNLSGNSEWQVRHIDI